MTTPAAPIPVEVDVLSFSKLFEDSAFPMAVDTYQRGFVWRDDKIRQLAEDLATYQRDADPKPPYYMGTILVHRNKHKQKHFIIDGQQRLTALCVLHHQLKGSLPIKCALTYSPKSARRISAAAGIFREPLASPSADIFGQIVFTVICVERVDLAFTFFDTQNNGACRFMPLTCSRLTISAPSMARRRPARKDCKPSAPGAGKSFSKGSR